MGYKPSPRPVFDKPSHIPYAGVTRHLWGEEDAGLVDDWIYASTDKIHQLVFGLQPGGFFKHTDAFRTIFGADELLYVLSGTFGLAKNAKSAPLLRANFEVLYEYLDGLRTPAPAKGTARAKRVTRERRPAR